MEKQSSDKSPKKLTRSQFDSRWLFCENLAEALDGAGYSQKKFLEKTNSFDIPITKDFIDKVWKHYQKAMFGTESSKDLLKTGQIDEIHEAIMRTMGEVYHIEYLPFPSEEVLAEQDPTFIRTHGTH